MKPTKPKPIPKKVKEVKPLKKTVKKVQENGLNMEVQIQIAKLDARLGKGVGAVRERARLLARSHLPS